MKKRWITLIFILALSVLLTAAAEDGTLTLPADLTTIEAEAFSGLTGVTRIDLPAGVTQIGAGAFRGTGDPAAELRYYFVPASITVGAGAFENCRAEIRINGTELPRLSYTVSASGVTITGVTGQPGEVTIPDTIGGQPVVAIGNNAFSGKRSMTRVTIPSTVTSLGQSAFSGCQALTELHLPAGLTSLGSGVFYDCQSLTAIDLPSGITALPNDAFYGCYELAEIDLTGITSLGTNVFRQCRALTEVTIPDSITVLPQSAFEEASGLTQVHLPDTLTAISNYAFYGCRALTEIHIPAGITAIPSGAFQNCAALQQVQLPAGLESIAQNAFRSCTALTGINFPSGLTSIGQEAFRDACVGQSANAIYVLPDSVETFGSNAFYNCGAGLLAERGSAREDFVRANGYTFAYDAADGFRYQYKKISSVDTLYLTGYKGTGGNVTIPAGPAVIAENAFADNTALTRVTIPAGVTEIGNQAFRDCTNLSRVTMPDSVTAIGNSAFAYCAKLTNVTFPAGLTSIGADAFDYACTAAGTHFYNLPNHIASLGSTPFSGCGAVLCFNRGSNTAALFRQNDYIYTYTGETDFRYRWYNNEGTEGHQERLIRYTGSAQTVEIPASIWLIDDSAFKSSTAVRKVIIPEGVTHIYANAFRDCENLTDITLPDTLREVRDNAFYGCGSAASAAFTLALPADIDIVCSGAFTSARMILICGLNTTTADRISNRGYAFVRADRPDELDFRYRWDYFDHVWNWGLYDYTGSLSSILLPDDCRHVISSMFQQKPDLELKCTQLSETALGLSEAGLNFTFPGHEGLRYRMIDDVLYLMGCAGNPSELVIPQAANYISEGWDEQVRSQSFQNLTALTRLVLPEGVTRLNDNAFSGCTNLTDIHLPDSLKFLGQKIFRYAGQNLDEPFCLELPDHMESLMGRHGGANSFEDVFAVLKCGKTSQTAGLLTDSNWVYTVEGEEDFRYRYISYTEGNETGRRLWLVGYEGDDTQVSIPSGIYGIRRFESNTTSSNWPTFHGYGFSGNQAVTKVVIPEGTVVIEDGAFQGCVNLTNITFPDSLRVLKNHAFEQCGKNADDLHYYVLPDNMTEISTNVDAGWGAFTDINKGRVSCAPGTSTALQLSGIDTYNHNGSYRFALKGHESDGLLYIYETRTENDQTVNRLVLKAYEGSGTTVTIPSGTDLYRIESSAFQDRQTLEQVTLPDGLVEIGEYAFSGCTLLHGGAEEFVIQVPGTVKHIGRNAFYEVGSGYAANRFYLVLPGALETFDISAVTKCNAVFVAPGGLAAQVLFDNWYYYYLTLADAKAGTNCKYKRAYDNQDIEIDHVHYGRR